MTRLLRWLFAGSVLMLMALWLTRLTAPRPVAALPTVDTQDMAAGLEPALRLFGATAQTPAQVGHIELTGVSTSTSGQGFATFRTREGARFALVGEEIGPGVRLKAVRGDHVIVLMAGVEHRLALPEKPAAAPALANANPDKPDKD